LDRNFSQAAKSFHEFSGIFDKICRGRRIIGNFSGVFRNISDIYGSFLEFIEFLKKNLEL
jgi:hypothetical protein